MKKGFTLIELLAVIAIIGILAVITVPNIIKSYNTTLTEKMGIDEANVKDAADLFLEDHCLSPLTGYSCPATYKDNNYICLNLLQNPTTDYGDAVNDSYIDTISFKKEVCKGYVQYNISSSNDSGKTYLYCGKQSDGTYLYKTNGADTSRCN